MFQLKQGLTAGMCSFLKRTLLKRVFHLNFLLSDKKKLIVMFTFIILACFASDRIKEVVAGKHEGS